MMRYCFLLFISVFLQASPNVYFDDRAAGELLKRIEAEDKKVHMAIYSFTHPQIIKALIAAKKRGVDVQVLIDASSVKSKSPAPRLDKQGIHLYLWEGSRMHGSFCVFDQGVWVGSLDGSRKYRPEDCEYALLLEDPKTVSLFEKRFLELRLVALPYKDRKERMQKQAPQTIDAVALQLDEKTFHVQK